MTTEVTTTDLQAFTESWLDWYRAQEARLADPHGFLAITGLHWLDDRPRRFPDAPGAWRTGPAGVVVDLDDTDELVIDGRQVRGEHRFGVLPERGGVDVVWKDAVLEVAKRGGQDILRPRHPNAPLRTAFTGTPAYAPDPRWAVTGRYVPFDEPRPTTVGAAVEGLEHVYDAPGRIEFELDGRPLSLTAFPGHGPGRLMVLFTDATSGVTTYAANRALCPRAPAARTPARRGGPAASPAGRSRRCPRSTSPERRSRGPGGPRRAVRRRGPAPSRAGTCATARG
ncbi:DUF1684 domain-containing protein [Streptomyces collinus]